MNFSSRFALIIGFLMITLIFINSFTITEITPAIQRSQVIAALTSVSILLIGFLLQTNNNTQDNLIKEDLIAEEGFYLTKEIDEDLRLELAWGSQLILSATAASTILIYYNKTIILRRGLITSNEFRPGNICIESSRKSKYISLVNMKFFPGRSEFDPIVPNLPSVIVNPLDNHGWLIVGGWTDRCFTKSDEIWIEGWSKKIYQKLSNLYTN
ncbi:cofactor assembly of complex C subunit B [Prochlorococcus marinus]|uniref:cofactor assembly of complex C subunit B n=1 Tax=Prochlorococcus marinus TaxID=1219 RepID=UPI0022B35955|nr:cofactor assembly of complex C subunit B [Prochlorococcus marinus]